MKIKWLEVGERYPAAGGKKIIYSRDGTSLGSSLELPGRWHQGIKQKKLDKFKKYPLRNT